MADFSPTDYAPSDSSPAAALAEERDRKTSVISPHHRKTLASPGETTQELPDELLLTPGKAGPLPLGHFEVHETIGRGGFGVVVKAFDRKLHRVVAIKMMSAELATTSPARRRFVREARTGAAVSHDNVVRIYAVEEEPLPYLVMEYVPGGSLQRHLDQSGPLGIRETLRIGAQIARGLAAAHEIGLIHRDVKPANVMLEGGETPKAKLTDFGLARAADDASISQSGTIVGTPMFMAPEQARGEPLDHRADLYSLGSVLYVMVSGRLPFRAETSLAVLKRVTDDVPRPIREFQPDVPQWVCDIVAKLHAKNPTDRFRSAAEVAGLLEKCLSDLEQNRTVRLPASVASPARRRRRTVGVLLGTLVSAAVGGYVATRPTSSEIHAPDPLAAATHEDPMPARYTNALGMQFARIPVGRSWLNGGSGNVNEKEVVIPTDFFMGVYEVTHEDWEKVLGPGHDPSLYTRTGVEREKVAAIPDDVLRRFPVDGVSWVQAQKFLTELNGRVRESGWVYRLPSVAEWEYACRGGPGQSRTDLGFDYYLSEPSAVLRIEQANFIDNQLDRPCPVGSYRPNRLGLYDMHGNVFEICDDEIVMDGVSYRSIKGGFWKDKAEDCRAKNQNLCNPSARHNGSGIRLVRIPVEGETRQHE